MPPKNAHTGIARFVRICLRQGASVEIDGLGTFRANGQGGYEFLPETRPRVFLAYAVEDRTAVRWLYRALEKAGFDPWMDCEKLLPGQNWPRAIERAIETSQYFIACLSPRSVTKPGTFQAELRWALDCAARQPFGDIYFIPVRLEECVVPVEIARSYQYVDLFPNRRNGLVRILRVLRDQECVRSRRQPPKAA